VSKIISFFTVVFVLGTINCFSAEIIDRETIVSGSNAFAGYVPDRIVVKFGIALMKGINKGTLKQGKSGIPALDELAKRHKAIAIKPQFPAAKINKQYRGKAIDLSGWHRIEFAAAIDPLAVVEEYKSLPGIVDAQPISIQPLYKIPIEQSYSSQWHLPKIQAPASWDIETGNPAIVVAILDTGVRYFAKDLGGANASYATPTNIEGNVWINGAEKNGTSGVDDDGNGYVDDWVGWDFVTATPAKCDSPSGEDCSDQDNDPRDFHGHGTHVAGIVAAINNNGEAVASVAGGWGNGVLESNGNGVKVMALRIGWSAFSGSAGYVAMDYAAEALYYAANKGAQIASCSWGSENTGGLGEAIDYFLADGGLIFKAAGNSNSDASTSGDYMCSRDDVVCVAATDQNDCKASFSNYGNQVDISAPGTDIWSLFHDWHYPETDHVAAMSGTSMAAPLAASVAALIWSDKPEWTAAQVKAQLYSSADNIDGLACNSAYSGLLGTGRINAFNAISIDSDMDGLPDYDDNCPTKPNGPNLGTCSVSSDKAGYPCNSNADCSMGCSSSGECQKNQEDTDTDGVGDVCDNCPANCNSQQLDADGDIIGDVCDVEPGCGGCMQPSCEQQC
jgi:subtilisin family serine protease